MAEVNLQAKVSKVADRVVGKIADTIIRRHRLFLFLLLLVTAFFVYNIFKIEIITNMDDLVSSNHTYVKLDKQFRDLFGGSNLVLVQVRAKKGDIFNEEVLSTVRRITDELTFFPGVDRNKVYSIGARKIKSIKVSSWGIENPPIMWPDIPKTPEAMNELKKNIFIDPTIYGKYVSFDGRAALISAEFVQEKVNYKVLFKEFQRVRTAEEKGNVDINLAGDPIIYGWIDHYITQTFILFAATFFLLVCFLYLTTRSIAFMVLPVMSALISGCWGLGFAGLLGYDIDPLILVIPMMLVGRSMSHSIQFNKRLQEELEAADKKEAVRRTVCALLFPGLAGIITDGTGILLLSLIPIPILIKIGVIGFFWAMSVCFTVLILNPIISLSLPDYLWKGWGKPVTEGAAEKGEKKDKFSRILRWVAGLSEGKNAWAVIGVTAVVFGIASYLNTKLILGDAKPGTPLLWEDSRYNTDEKKINEYFPGVMNPFLIVVEGNDIDVIKQPEVLNTMAQFQRYLAGLPEVGGTLSFADLVKNVTMKYYEDMPKYNVIPATLEEIGQVAYLMQGGGAEPGDFDPFFDLHFKLSNIRIYCRDRVGTTIESVIKKCEEFIAKASEDKDFSKFAKFKLGAGLIALRASIIQDIDEFQLTLLILALASMAFFCTLFFQSFSPTWIFIVPLFLSEYLAFSYLAVRGIGLNVDSCPVISIAIGIGDDYGIYLLSRIKEEFATSRDLNKAVSVAIQTTGKAITLIAVTLGLSVITWAFSSIAFQADMGFLLALVTCFHLIGTLTFLPALVRLVKPGFIVNQPL